MTVTVHLLDVGQGPYGDAVLLQFDDASVLIDGAHQGDQVGKGGHEGIPDQLSRLLDQAQPPFSVDLLVVSHGHSDHIGCLPYLVAHNLLRAEWALVADPQLGWGRAADEAPDFSSVDPRVRQLAAALREEIPPRLIDDGSLSGLIADAADLESRYTEMLDALRNRKGQPTSTIRLGRDDPTELLEAFEGIGFQILGPSDEHLQTCAQIIAEATEDMVQMASDLMRADERLSTTEAYRALAWGVGLADAAADRPGPAINLQSAITTFDSEGVRLLLGGDMQWIDPEVDNQVIADSVAALRASVHAAGPYAFAKLSHHGSDNAFSEDLLAELGATKLYGICAGERSTAHPDPAVLEVLDEHRAEIRWARTDRNRSATFTFGDGQPKVTVDRGELNDPTPNQVDQPPEVTRQGVPTISRRTVAPEARPLPSTGSGEIVEVIARIPHQATQLSLTVGVAPQAAQLPAGGSARPDEAGLHLAGGRDLPELLFVTNAHTLAAHIGAQECQAVVEAIRASGHPFIEDVDPADSTGSVTRVRNELRALPNVQGVVLVGGYDVVPARVVDCLPPSLRTALRHNGDADDFIVWSDDPYGDRDGDGLPELPVSRVPDGNSAQLVRGALEATNEPRAVARCGVRNSQRPFADGIYDLLPHPRDLLVSAPSTYDQVPGFVLDGDAVYVMLHGDFDDSTRFWGEDPPEFPVALAMSNVPQRAGRVVFAGCCWGALTVDKRASRVAPGVRVGQKTPANSLALACLAAGATAFVGCTGSHYSPRQPPYDSAGGPMHQAFWTRLRARTSPAQALFQAKVDFARGMPHGQTTPPTQGIEYKILREFTCLGLGW